MNRYITSSATALVGLAIVAARSLTLVAQTPRPVPPPGALPHPPVAIRASALPATVLPKSVV